MSPSGRWNQIKCVTRPHSRRKVRRSLIECLETRRLLATDLLTYHSSAGVNSTETRLTPGSLNVDSFGKRFSIAVDGQVYAEPLYVSNANITSGPYAGTHRVVFAATEHNSLYAIDSDSGIVLWQKSFINPSTGITSVPAADVGSNDLTPEIGITATPVIDLANNVLYVETKTKEIRNSDPHPTHYVQTLYRVNISDGSYIGAVIADTAYFNGDYFYRNNADPYTINDQSLGIAHGVIQVGNESRVYFNALTQLVRPALIIQNGSLYIASASHGDNGPYHGWILRYDVTGATPVLSGVLNTTPNGGLGGIWQAGGTPVFDSLGNIYVETGNGTFSPYRSGNAVFGLDAQGFPIDGNYGDSFIKISPDTARNSATNQNKNGWGLKVVDYFTPFNEEALDEADRDLGSGSPIVLPDSLGSAAHPHLLLGAGKEGKIYLIDRDNMGKSDPGYNQSGVLQSGGTDHVVQTISGALSGVLSTPTLANVGSAASPDWRAFFTPGYGGNLKSYAISNGALSLNSVSTANDLSYGNLSGSSTLSQNGITNSILWALDRNSNSLRAYDAANLTSVLYTSAQAALNRDQLTGLVTKFSVPAVADGKVFVGTSNALLIYGPPVAPTTAPAAPTNLAALAPFPTQVVLSWTDRASNEDFFSVERSTDVASGWTEVGQASANAVNFTDDSVSANVTYYYRVRGYNSFGGGSYSDYSEIVTAVATANPGGTGDGLLATYFAGPAFTGSTLQRIDPQVNFNWNFDSPAAGIPVDNFSAVWTGVIRPAVSGNYRFYTTSDDGVVLYINGLPVINNWTDHGSTEDISVPIALTGGTSYTIRLEYYEEGALAQAELRWSSEFVPKAFVPQSALYSGTAPAAPTNLVVVPASGTQNSLSWADNSTTETGFIIQRKQGAGGTYAQIAIVPPEATTYQDSALLADTTYFYRVQAANFASNSAFSNEASATTPVPPLTPANARPTLVTTTTITFAWDDTSNNEDKFSIFRRAGNGSFIFVADVPANTTTYTNSGLQPGISYDYHIQAWNLGGYTDFAGFVVTTVTAPPSNVLATAGAGQVALSWNASTGAIAYNIYRGTSPGGEAAEPIGTGLTGTTYADTAVVSGTVYYYQVTAITTGGESAKSLEASAALGTGNGLLGTYYLGTALTGTPIQRIDPQVNFSWGNASPMAGITSDLFSVAWTGSIRPPTTGNYTFYATSDDGVRLYVNGQLVINNWTVRSATENASSPITLVGGQRYAIRMEYYENAGAATAQLRWSSAQIAKQVVPQSVLFATSAPLVPTNLVATAGAARVTLTWSATPGATFYNIYRGTSAGGEATQPFATGITGTSFAHTGLTAGGTYYYKITAVTGGVESVQSAEVFAAPTGNGLSATYYAGANFTGAKVQRVDPQVNFNWGTTAPAAGIPKDFYSVVWTGTLRPTATGNYTFYTNSDDGVRLYVNNQRVINNWTVHGAIENKSAVIALSAGQAYAIRMEYYENTGSAVAQLKWSSSKISKVAIPQSVLFSASPAAPLKASKLASSSTAQTTSTNISSKKKASIASGPAFDKATKGIPKLQAQPANVFQKTSLNTVGQFTSAFQSSTNSTDNIMESWNGNVASSRIR
jgi:fibronectin type 3 domain-containing protein